MSSDPLVSVILCTYNGEQFLKKQVESILSQTYLNIELIIVDDCSTDNTFEVLSEYARRTDKISLYKNDENLGFNLNFNRAICLGKGEFVTISDQDDIWLPHKIETLISNIGHKGIIFSNSRFMNENDELLNKYLLYSINNEDLISYKKLLHYNFVTGHTIMFNRRMTDSLLPIPQKGYYDWWIGFIGLYHNELTYCNEVLTYYRIHNSSVMQQERLENKTKKKDKIDYEKMLIQLDALLNYKGLSSDAISFLKAMKMAYVNKQTKIFSFHFFAFLHKNFFAFYPERRKKKWVNNIIFFIKRIL